jgi:endonuclease/exonuclease/phosphatase family metal-dependent hydrolase
MVLIASYNIRKAIAADRRRRPERIIDILAEMDADVVILQEADRRFGDRHSAIPLPLLTDHSPYRPVPYDMRHGSIGWHGNAILVKTGIAIERHQPLHLPTLEPRGAVLADLAVPGEGRLRVVGMHLDLSGLWRRKQARAILDDLHGQPGALPTLLAGDLNEWTRGGCLRDFGAHHRPLPLGHSFPARRPIGRLDRMFVSEGITIEECGVHASALARTASDHLPVWARITLE